MSSGLCLTSGLCKIFYSRSHVLIPLPDHLREHSEESVDVLMSVAHDHVVVSHAHEVPCRSQMAAPIGQIGVSILLRNNL